MVPVLDLVFKLFKKKESLPSLSELGIFGIAHEQYDERTFCFYLQRSFGNILIHKTLNLSDYYNSFKNRGGVYKQIDFIPHYTTMNKEIFDIFGASLVSESEFQDIKYPCEVFNQDFKDAHIKEVFIANQKSILVYLKERWLLFLHPTLSDQSLFNQKDWDEISNSKCEFIFFHKINASQRCYFKTQEFKEFVK